MYTKALELEPNNYNNYIALHSKIKIFPLYMDMHLNISNQHLRGFIYCIKSPTSKFYHAHASLSPCVERADYYLFLI